MVTVGRSRVRGHRGRKRRILPPPDGTEPKAWSGGPKFLGALVRASG